MIRNVIFDWSGTLVDDLEAVWRSTNYTLKKSGVPEMSLSEFRDEFSLPLMNFTPGSHPVFHWINWRCGIRRAL